MREAQGAVPSISANTGHSVPTRNGVSAALDLVQRLPPEAIIEIVQIVGDIVRARAVLSTKHAEFLHEMQRFREANENRERLMTTLSALLLDADLSDEAKLKLVDTICQLALR